MRSSLCEIFSLVPINNEGGAVTIKISGKTRIKAQFAWHQFKSLSTMILTVSRASGDARATMSSFLDYTGSGESRVFSVPHFLDHKTPSPLHIVCHSTPLNTSIRTIVVRDLG